MRSVWSTYNLVVSSWSGLPYWTWARFFDSNLFLFCLVFCSMKLCWYSFWKQYCPNICMKVHSAHELFYVGFYLRIFLVSGPLPGIICHWNKFTENHCGFLLVVNALVLSFELIGIWIQSGCGSIPPSYYCLFFDRLCKGLLTLRYFF